MAQNEYYSSVALSEHVGAHDLRWADEKKKEMAAGVNNGTMKFM
jgi:hypothetical protein